MLRTVFVTQLMHKEWQLLVFLLLVAVVALSVAECRLGSEYTGTDKSRGHHDLCVKFLLRALAEQSGAEKVYYITNNV